MVSKSTLFLVLTELQRSVNFEMYFWCLQFSQKSKEKKSQIFCTFFEIIEDTKKKEINWPLDSSLCFLVSLVRIVDFN